MAPWKRRRRRGVFAGGQRIIACICRPEGVDGIRSVSSQRGGVRGVWNGPCRIGHNSFMGRWRQQVLLNQEETNVSVGG